VHKPCQAYTVSSFSAAAETEESVAHCPNIRNPHGHVDVRYEHPTPSWSAEQLHWRRQPVAVEEREWPCIRGRRPRRSVLGLDHGTGHYPRLPHSVHVIVFVRPCVRLFAIPSRLLGKGES
jgi:hypothetical protein